MAWRLARLEAELYKMHERIRCNYTGEVFHDENSEHTFIDTVDYDELYAIDRLKAGYPSFMAELLRSRRELHHETLNDLADYLENLPSPKRRKHRARPVSVEQYDQAFETALSQGEADVIGYVCDKTGMERTVVYEEYRRYKDGIIGKQLASEFQLYADCINELLKILRDNPVDT